MTTKQTFKIDYRSYGKAVEAAARREQTGHMPMDPAVRGFLNDDGIVTFEFGSNLTPDERPVVWRERWDFSTFDRDTPIEEPPTAFRGHNLGPSSADHHRKTIRRGNSHEKDDGEV